MKRKHFTILAILLIVSLAFISSNKSFEVDARNQPPPYKTGISSPGAIPVEPPDDVLRDSRDVAYFEDKVDWLALNINKPRTAWEHLQYGLYLHSDLLKEEEAIEHFKTAIFLDEAVTGGKMIMPHARLCEIYLENGLYDDAIAHCTSVGKLDPILNGYNDRIAKAYVGKGDFDKAIEFFQKELDIQGGVNQTVFFELAEIYLKKDNKAKALEFFKKYLEEAKFHSDPYPLRIKFAEKEVKELESLLVVKVNSLQESN